VTSLEFVVADGDGPGGGVIGICGGGAGIVAGFGGSTAGGGARIVAPPGAGGTG